MKTSTQAQAMWDDEYAHCARSPEWKAGALRGLQIALHEPAQPAGMPYASGTAQDDAWRAGVQAGLAEAKCRRTTTKPARVAA